MGQGSGEKARENINMLEAEFKARILRKNDFPLNVVLVSPTSALQSGKMRKGVIFIQTRSKHEGVKEKRK